MARYSIEFLPKSLMRRVRVDVVIPSLGLQETIANTDENYYQNLDKKYPLLIVLHGFGEDAKSWQNNSLIIKHAEAHGFACAFVYGENKWYLNMGPIDDFYSLVERDLPDFLYGNFRCLSKDMPLAICGNSMGGYGALYHYLKNPDKYACAIALSPATRPDFVDETKIGSIRELALANKDKKLNVYLSIGEEDFIIGASKELDQYFKDNNIGISYKYIPGADHSWKTWAKEVDNVCDYLVDINFAK